MISNSRVTYVFDDSERSDEFIMVFFYEDAVPANMCRFSLTNAVITHNIPKYNVQQF